MRLETRDYLLYIWDTEEYTPERSGRPQLKKPAWLLDLFPAPAEKITRRAVPRISRRMKARTMPRTVERSIPATVRATLLDKIRGEKLPKISF